MVLLKYLRLDPLITRQQPLQTFHRLSSCINELAPASGSKMEELLNAIVAECVLCGIRVNGSEISKVTKVFDREGKSKLGRLRFGYCARKGCKSYFYKVSFYPNPHCDWREVVPRMDVGG